MVFPTNVCFFPTILKISCWVVNSTHVWFFPNMCDFCHTCMIFTKHVRFIPKRGTVKPKITYNWFLNYFMTLDCHIKKVNHSCGKRRCEWTGVQRSGGRHYLPPARQASQAFSTKEINCNFLWDRLEFSLPSVPCVTRTTPLWEEPLVASLHCAKTSLLYLEDHL